MDANVGAPAWSEEARQRVRHADLTKTFATVELAQRILEEKLPARAPCAPGRAGLRHHQHGWARTGSTACSTRHADAEDPIGGFSVRQPHGLLRALSRTRRRLLFRALRHPLTHCERLRGPRIFSTGGIRAGDHGLALARVARGVFRGLRLGGRGRLSGARAWTPSLLRPIPDLQRLLGELARGIDILPPTDEASEVAAAVQAAREWGPYRGVVARGARGVGAAGALRSKRSAGDASRLVLQLSPDRLARRPPPRGARIASATSGSDAARARPVKAFARRLNERAPDAWHEVSSELAEARRARAAAARAQLRAPMRYPRGGGTAPRSAEHRDGLLSASPRPRRAGALDFSALAMSDDPLLLSTTPTWLH